MTALSEAPEHRTFAEIIADLAGQQEALVEAIDAFEERFDAWRERLSDIDGSASR